MARKKELPTSVDPVKAETLKPETAKSKSSRKVNTNEKTESDIVDPSDTEYAAKCKILGENIRHERKSRGFSIENLAEYLELSTSYVGLLERGARCPSLRKFFDICTLFSAEPNDLLMDKGESSLTIAEQHKKTHVKDNFGAVKSLIQSLNEDQLVVSAAILKQVKKLDKSAE